MKFLLLGSTDPYHNLAVEEYIFEKTQDNVFILWQNDKTVVIGKNQNINCELDFDFVNKNGIKVARRITGGGAVYHDLGNLNYSFISSTGKEGIDFAYFTRPIIDALTALGVDARLTGRNDIEVEGKKISGNAQYSKNGRTLHHGTLLFDTDLSVLSSALRVDEEKIKSKAKKSTRSRVTNLKSLIPIKDINEFIDYLCSFIINKFSPETISEPNDEYITELEQRNRSEEWLFPKSSYLSSFTVRKKKKYDFGIVDIELSMSGDIISDVKIYGDFFGTKDLSELSEKISGNSISEIDKILENTNLSDYILGMTSGELSELIKRG
jgi:lipoate-protein ligase A